MHVVYPRCGALDLGKDILMAAVRIQEGSNVTCECRTYGTKTKQILDLSEWLTSHGVTHVVMEATGSYWKWIWRMLEGHFELTLANPAQVRSLPGRKTDKKDATRLADLHAHGLIQGSFVPPVEIDSLRDLTRTRKQFVREIGRHTQRIQKMLDVAGIKITGLVTDVLGVSGRAMVKALIAGETDPQKLVALAHPCLRASRAELLEALRGKVTAGQRFLLSEHLHNIEHLEGSLDRIDEEIAKAVEPFRALIERLRHIPGMSDVSIPAVLAEIGVDMSRFESHEHLVSWARLSPRNDESAGKVHSRRTLKGANWIKTTMTQAAWAASRAKRSYFHALYRRLCNSTKNKNKAIVGVAASMLTVIYHMIRERTPYRELGADYFERQNKADTARRLVKRLRRLGYDVEITNPAA